MTVQELIDELTKLPPDLSVKLAFDTGVRMDAEICQLYNDSEEGISVVITDESEWGDRDNF